MRVNTTTTHFGLEAIGSRGPGFGQEGGAMRAPDRRKVDDARGGGAGRDAAINQSLIAATFPKGAALSVRRIEQRLSVVSPQRFPTADPSQAQSIFPSMPAKRDSYSTYIGFALCVLVPTLIAAVYFGFIAATQYVSEFRFSVQDTTASSGPIPSSITSALGGPASTNVNDNYLVIDFLTSRATTEELQKRIKVTSLYAKPEADWWSRFNASLPMERFVLYWQHMVTAQYDMISGIATVSVRAFTPKDALLIADTMVTLSEELINQIANRSQIDAVRFAQQEVDRAQERLSRDHAKLTEYRNRVGLIDPTTSVSVSNATLVQSQRANLAQLNTQLTTLVAQNLQPDAPAIIALKNQIKSTKEQLAITEADVGRGITGSALSSIVGEYEQINLELQFAEAMVTSTERALDLARANAAAQHLYITPYVQPSLPQSSTYPRRLLSIAAVAALSFIFWVIGLLITRSIRERFA